jgi:hypothetical protein
MKMTTDVHATPSAPPYECGVFECSIGELIRNTNLILCNERGDALFFFDRDEAGSPIFLVSPIEPRHRASVKRWQKRIPWEDYSYCTGDEKDFLIPRGRVRRACRMLGLTLKKPAQTEKQVLAYQRNAASLRRAAKAPTV